MIKLHCKKNRVSGSYIWDSFKESVEDPELFLVKYFFVHDFVCDDIYAYTCKKL